MYKRQFDNIPKIQQALNALRLKGGGTLVFPVGTYYVKPSAKMCIRDRPIIGVEHKNPQNRIANFVSLSISFIWPLPYNIVI